MSIWLRLTTLCLVLLSVSLTGSAPRLSLAGPASAYAGGQSASLPALHPPSKRIAIVIDDFGNRMSGTEDILALPIPLTVAVMPFLPSSKEDAEEAHRRGHEVIIHMPMEPNRGKKEWLGPGALTADMSDAEIRNRVEAAIEAIPHAVGMNNHMGSKITADRRIMTVVLEVCREHGLYYLDSRTTHKSVITEVADKVKVPVLINKLFLDDRYQASHIQRQLVLLARYLQESPEVIAIGHVGPSGKNVASLLRRWSPEQDASTVFVTASHLIPSMARDQQILP
ncbi:divergent polysaccharide deacetylase family protein [Paenibacillus sp. 1P07SE]|uniref:divergent polysaccharide deacetylase family protein n=1 Tax=Paenibacillus sp. 1P07SE TaxID=3132209 RepID=UPI0039A56BDA